MGEKEESRMVAADGAFEGHWPWASAGAAQLGWGVASIKRGYAGQNNLMPLKAFAVATLFVGGASSTAVAMLQLSGIRSVSIHADLSLFCRIWTGFIYQFVAIF